MMKHKTLALVGLLTFGLATAMAHPPFQGSEDYEIMTPYSDWIQSVDNSKGWRCCDISDARLVDVRQKDNHWEVKFRYPEDLPAPAPQGWQIVPDDAIVRDSDGKPVSSPAGLTIAWWYAGAVRCFTIPTVF